MMTLSRREAVSLFSIGGLAAATIGVRPAWADDPGEVRYNFKPERYSATPSYTGKRTVRYSGPHRPGTIIISTSKRRLYFVLPGDRAIEYGVGVGRAGFDWSGTAKIARKAKWPDWRPPKEMIIRERKQNGREIPPFVEGGPNNPLGARALYLYQGGRDTLYRIHGTNAPHTIGLAMSSGCIRMLNEEVIDLYQRVRIGAKVVVS